MAVLTAERDQIAQPGAVPGVWSRAIAHAFAPVDVLPLAYLRIMFGAIMVWEVGRYFAYGWIGRYYIDPIVHFHYAGFEWVQPWPGVGMYLHFIALGVLAACIAFGVAYRVVMPLFTIAFAYVFLLDSTNYLNHFYLIILVCLLLCVVPAHRALSIDARHDAVRADDVPAWTIGVFRFLLVLVYVYAALAKINPDWLAGEPMRTWMAERADLPIIGPLLTQEWAVMLFSYGGIAIDAFAAPLLVAYMMGVRRLLVPALLALLALISFHLLNAHLFSIGIFPWLMIAVLPLLLPTRWWVAPLRRLFPRGGDPIKPTRAPALIIVGLAAFAAFNLAFPLRHWFIPGDVAWTEEGHRFSWRMKLNDKYAEAMFYVYTAQGSWVADPANYLTARQQHQMPQHPDMILQFAHYLRDDALAYGYTDVRVTVWAAASLNGREMRLMINPLTDLAAETWHPFAAHEWIIPLDSPLGVIGG